jgi:hypothetical protein
LRILPFKAGVQGHQADFRPLVGHKCIGKNDQDSQKLQADPPTHQLLAEIGITALHHRVQTVKQHGEDGKDGDGTRMIEKCLHSPDPLLTLGVGLSLRLRRGNHQVVAPRALAADFTPGLMPSITHLKFALVGKSLNPCGALYSAPAPRRVFPLSGPMRFRLEAK